MAHITLAQKGLEAAAARNWEEAVTKLSGALETSTNPSWLIARSKAFVSLGKFQEAVDDADLAWHTAYERNKRPLLSEAHYRRAVAYFRMGQFANADCCCVYAMRLVKGFPAVEKENPAKEWTDSEGFWTVTLADVTKEAQTDEINSQEKGTLPGTGSAAVNPQAKEWRMASTLRMQILNAMQKLPADDAARKVTIAAKPEKKSLVTPETKPKEAAKSVPVVAHVKPVIPSDTPMRLQEFQSNTTMSVSIFSKGVDKEKLKVDFQPKSVKLDPLIYPSGEERLFELNLWGEIDPSSSKFTVTPNKVELSLVKKLAGKWAQLTSTATETEQKQPQVPVEKPIPSTAAANKVTADTAKAADDDTKPPESDIQKPAEAHSYPTSSKSGPKDWDKLGDDGGSDEEGDVNIFFKKLYKNASPEQQRAMMKSFTESNGTSLSTDWDDVQGRTVETVPPEGVEAKKWK